MNLATQDIQSVFAPDELDSNLESYLDKIKEDPNNPWSYSRAGDYLLEADNPQKAYFFYKKALELKPDFHGFYYKLGVVSQKLHNFQQSNFYYATSINLNPNNYWYYDSLCQNLVSNNQITQAITYYQQALRLGEQLPKIYRQLGSLYSRLGNSSNAIIYYQKVIELEPNKFDYFYLAEALFQDNQIELAVANYQKTLALSNNFREAHQRLGDALSKQRDFEEGILHYRKAKYIINSSSNKNFLASSERNYLIDRKHRFIYCPIPKVACSSFKKLILKINEPECYRHIRETLSETQFHSYLDLAYSLFRYDERTIETILQENRYFKFAFVRNPWNRLVSAYLNKFVPSVPLPVSHTVIKSIYQEKGLRYNLQKSVTFREFIYYLASTEDRVLDKHWKPQYLFLGNDSFDFIGKLENIEEDFQYIKQKLNLNLDLDWLNKTEKMKVNPSTDKYADFYPEDLRKLKVMPNYKSFYTPELVEVVKNRYQTDIQMFDYKFE